MTDEEYAAHEASAADEYDDALETYRADPTDENRVALRGTAAALQAIRKARREAREQAAAAPAEGG